MKALKPLGSISVDSILAVMVRDDQIGDEAVFSSRMKPPHPSDVRCLLNVGTKQLWCGCLDGSISLWDIAVSTVFALKNAR